MTPPSPPEEEVAGAQSDARLAALEAALDGWKRRVEAAEKVVEAARRVCLTPHLAATIADYDALTLDSQKTNAERRAGPTSTP